MLKKQKKTEYTAIQFVLRSYLLLILCGAILLKLPIATHLEPNSFIDSLFMSTSAVCVTGLAVVDISQFTFFGQAVILFLIQVGGIGIVFFTTFFMILVFRRISFSDSFQFKGILAEPTIANIRRLIRRILLFIFGFEIVGIGLLFFVFNRDHHFSEALWYATFHAISAFCNAGFSLFPDSFIRYYDSLALNSIAALLIVTGGIGIVVYDDIYQKGKSILFKKRRHVLTIHTKLVLLASFVLIVGCMACFLILEQHNALIGKTMHESLLVSFFQSVTARTAGFNTIEMSELSLPMLAVLEFLMFIGGAPASCAGGIKVTTFIVLGLLLVNTFKGRLDVQVFRRQINDQIVIRAVSLVIVSVLLIWCSAFIIIISESWGSAFIQRRGDFMRVMFECVSAYGTVGLSMGITESLSTVSKTVLIFLMFVGRLGPLSFGILLANSKRKAVIELPQQDILIG
jgi:trk system potassium uptake protein